MKIKITYIVLSLLVLLTGCAKHSNPDSGSIAMPTSYIFFSQSLDTKAPLVASGADMGSFGVVGYKYDKSIASWNNTNAADRQAVFYDYNASNQAVPVYNETITINSEGICSYEPLQGWSNTKKYTFFAYYPTSHVTIQTDNTGTPVLTYGSPTIVYEMDCSSATALKASMADVMTASCHKDLYGYSSIGDEPTTGDINFSFDHHLSCVGVKVKKTSACNIVLNSITLNVSGITSNKITIPLDGGNKTITPLTNALENQELSLTMTDDEKSGAVTSDGTELSDKLIFIPQPENKISIQAVVNYTRKATGYADLTSEVTLDAVHTTLAEKNKYLIQLNFTDSTVEVSRAFDQTGWVDIDDVYDTFN